MKTQLPWHLLICFLSILAAAPALAAGESGTRLRYTVLSARTEMAPPFAAVDFVYGPVEKVGRQNFFWWRVEARTNAEQNTTPLFAVRCLTSGDPLAKGRAPLQFARYQLQIPETGEALEYVDVHSGRALLPAWGDFEKYFIPGAASASRRQNGGPETCEFLGHVLTLRDVGRDAWGAWPNVKRLELDREMLVGTGRNVKDEEGKRLSQTPKPQDYTYIKFTAEDYKTMVGAGMNLFTVAPEQEQWVRSEPVFYLRPPDGNPPLRYPADLYRANYFGAGMFIDEPASIWTWDQYVKDKIRHFSDVAAMVEKRTRATFLSQHDYGGQYRLERQLTDARVNFGDMRLAQLEIPVWETYYDQAFYEMKGGGSGIVHEGRYRLARFDDAVARFTGEKRRHTAREMLRYHNAFLRGSARSFGKFWGTAIYGQCDPAIAPEAFTLAYEMGARYFWFWTSDHGHHVPWPEQLELARALTRHAREHPRPSIYAPPPKRDVAIAIPNGYFLSFEKLSRWVQVLDKEGKNEESQKFHRLMQRALNEVHECFERREDFDITVDDGRPIKGYRRIVRISAD